MDIEAAAKCPKMDMLLQQMAESYLLAQQVTGTEQEGTIQPFAAASQQHVHFWTFRCSKRLNRTFLLSNLVQPRTLCLPDSLHTIWTFCLPTSQDAKLLLMP